MLISLYLSRYNDSIMWPPGCLFQEQYRQLSFRLGKQHCKMLTKGNLLTEWCGLRPHTHTHTHTNHTYMLTPIIYRWGSTVFATERESNAIINTWQTTCLYRFFSWNLSSEEKNKGFVINHVPTLLESTWFSDIWFKAWKVLENKHRSFKVLELNLK